MPEVSLHVTTRLMLIFIIVSRPTHGAAPAPSLTLLDKPAPSQPAGSLLRPAKRTIAVRQCQAENPWWGLN